MNDLLKSLDNLLKPVNEAMRNLPAGQLVRYVAVYMLIAGIFSICGGIGLITAGALSGFGGALGAAALNEAGANSAEAAQAMSSLAAVSGLAVIWGILSIIAAPLLLIAAVGLFQRKSWARMAAVVAFLVNAGSSLIGLLSGNGGILGIVWILIGLYLAYYFYTDPGIKQELSA